MKRVWKGGTLVLKGSQRDSAEAGLGVEAKTVVCVPPSWASARASLEKGFLSPHDSRAGHNWIASFLGYF